MNYQELNSIKNPNIINLKKLRDFSKERRLQKQYIIEGENIISQTIGIETIEDLFVQKNKLDRYKELIEKLKYKRVFVIDEKLMKSVSLTVTPPGILATVKIKKNISKNENLVLVLDGLRDPGNCGTIIRVATAFNIDKIFFVDSIDPYQPKCSQSSMGGIMNVEINEIKKIDHQLDEYKILTLDLNGTDLKKFDKKSIKNVKTALVVGSEAHGVSKEIKSITDEFLTIKMSNNIESLNAAIAISIAMYEITK